MWCNFWSYKYIFNYQILKNQVCTSSCFTIFTTFFSSFSLCWEELLRNVEKLLTLIILYLSWTIFWYIYIFVFFFNTFVVKPNKNSSLNLNVLLILTYRYWLFIQNGLLCNQFYKISWKLLYNIKAMNTMNN